MEDKKTRERNMFGETIEEMREAASFVDLTDPDELLRYAASILSDAQEATNAHASPFLGHEVARQFINKAKYFIAEARSILRERS